VGDKSKIEWTEASWNPVLGCSKVSPGCQNCYAVQQSFRNEQMGSQAYSGLTVLHPNNIRDWSGKVTCLEDRLEIPLRWKRPRKIFVNSMSDLFHKDVPDEFICDVFNIIRRSNNEQQIRGVGYHVFQILTKRPDRMADLVSRLRFDNKNNGRGVFLDETPSTVTAYPIIRSLPNVWLGTSVENQATADERIPYLLQTPAAVRWLSCEPLLGPVDLTIQDGTVGDNRYNQFVLKQAFGDPRELWACPKCEGTRYRETDPVADFCKSCKGTGVGIDWLVCGGESGPKARPMHPDWARGLRDQCKQANVPYFFKQWGEYGPTENGLLLGKPNGSTIKVYTGFGEGNLMTLRGKANAGRQLDGVEHNEYPL